MGQRRDARVDAKIDVRLFGMDGQDKPFQSTAQTMEVSQRGASLTEIRHYFKPGQMIGIAVGERKGRFRIVWVGHHNSPRVGQIGVQQVGMANETIWGVKLPEHFLDKESRPNAHVIARGEGTLNYLEYRAERRTEERKGIRAGARMKVAGNPRPAWATCTDLNLGGCFLEHPNQELAPGTRMEVTIKLNDEELTAAGVVRAKKGQGIGVEFTHLSAAAKDLIAKATAATAKFVQPLKQADAESDDEDDTEAAASGS